LGGEFITVLCALMTAAKRPPVGGLSLLLSSILPV
jgi:hypothetical protein